MESRTRPESPNPNPEIFLALTTHANHSSFFRQKQEAQPYQTAAANAASNARMSAFAILPVVTLAGIQMLTAKGDYVGPILNTIGIPFTVGGVVIDVVKAPFAAAFAAEETVRSGVLQLESLMFDKNVNDEQVKAIYASFLLRMQETANLIVGLGLESAEEMNAKITRGDVEDLIRLSLLYTAFHSRKSHTGLELASNKMLLAEDCPASGKELFNRIIQLKNTINQALGSDHYRSDAEVKLHQAETICRWIRQIHAGKPLTSDNAPYATDEQRRDVNSIITQLEDIKTCALAAMPATPEQAASSLPSFGGRR